MSEREKRDELEKLSIGALGGAAILPGLVGCGGGGSTAASNIRMIAVGDNGQVAAYRVELNGSITSLFSDIAAYDWVSVVPGRNPGIVYLSASDETQIGVLGLVDDTDFTGDFVIDSQAAGSKLFKHPTKNALYAMHSGLDVIEQYAINSDNTLTALALPTALTDDQPMSMVFSTDGNYAYVVCEGDETIRAYQVSPNGTLTQLPGAVYAAGNNPRKAVISDDQFPPSCGKRGRHSNSFEPRRSCLPNGELPRGDDWAQHPLLLSRIR